MKFERGDLLTIRTDSHLYDLWSLGTPRVAMYEERNKLERRSTPPRKSLTLEAGDVVIFIEEPHMNGLRVVEPKSGLTGIVSKRYFKKVE
jgi:hypothetical protein